MAWGGRANGGDLGDVGSIPGSGRPPGGGDGSPLQYSCLENLIERGTWWATVHRVTKSPTWLEGLSTHKCPLWGSEKKKKNEQCISDVPLAHSCDTTGHFPSWLSSQPLPHQDPPLPATRISRKPAFVRSGAKHQERLSHHAFLIPQIKKDPFHGGDNRGWENWRLPRRCAEDTAELGVRGQSRSGGSWSPPPPLRPCAHSSRSRVPPQHPSHARVLLRQEDRVRGGREH